MQIEVRVHPKARRDSLEVLAGPKLRVHVTAAPEGGKANAAVIALLAKRLGVPKGSIRIVRGHKTRDKLLRVDGLRAEELLDRLAAQ